MDKTLTEMAIRGLEVERQRINDAIRELRSQIEDGSGRQKRQDSRPSEPQPVKAPEQQPAQKHRMSPEERKRISEANRRRALLRKQSATAAKHAGPAPAKKAPVKGGLTPEGRARLAEAVRQRNIARAAAHKKAPAT